MVPIEEALKGRSTTFLAGRPQSPQKPNGTTNGGHSIHVFENCITILIIVSMDASYVSLCRE